MRSGWTDLAPVLIPSGDLDDINSGQNNWQNSSYLGRYICVRCLHRKKIHWLQEPRQKIFDLGDSVIAFAGHPAPIRSIINQYQKDGSGDVNIIIESWQKDIETDILHINKSSLIMTEMKNGHVTQRVNSWLGSQSAFNIYQSKRSQPNEELGEVFFSGMVIPELIATDSNHFEQYSLTTTAFQLSLQNSDQTFGGLMIPYAISRNESGFGGYSTVIRGALSDEEIAPGVSLPLDFSDSYGGEFTVSVWGTEKMSAFYFPNASLGFLTSLGEEVEIYDSFGKVHGLEFSYLSSTKGAGEGLSTWDSLHNYKLYLYHNLKNGELDRVDWMLNKVKNTIESGTKKLNKGLEVDLEKIGGPKNILEVTTNVSTLNHMDLYFMARKDRARRFVPEEFAAEAERYEAFSRMLGELKFLIKFGTLSC